ncbi:MAG TPA: hypothetical protein VFE10_10350 [Phenylobacterium sp.]|jgi:hypothetical protein|nr:hypothetical protein [Phenylobacterium sp.]
MLDQDVDSGEDAIRQYAVQLVKDAESAIERARLATTPRYRVRYLEQCRAAAAMIGIVQARSSFFEPARLAGLNQQLAELTLQFRADYRATGRGVKNRRGIARIGRALKSLRRDNERAARDE